jgi:hypothetical protein
MLDLPRALPLLVTDGYCVVTPPMEIASPKTALSLAIVAQFHVEKFIFDINQSAAICINWELKLTISH